MQAFPLRIPTGFVQHFAVRLAHLIYAVYTVH